MACFGATFLALYQKLSFGALNFGKKWKPYPRKNIFWFISYRKNLGWSNQALGRHFHGRRIWNLGDTSDRILYTIHLNTGVPKLMLLYSRVGSGLFLHIPVPLFLKNVTTILLGCSNLFKKWSASLKKLVVTGLFYIFPSHYFWKKLQRFY